MSTNKLLIVLVSSLFFVFQVQAQSPTVTAGNITTELSTDANGDGIGNVGDVVKVSWDAYGDGNIGATFDGVNDYVDVGSPTELLITSDVTLSFVTTPTVLAYNRYIVAFQNSGELEGDNLLYGVNTWNSATTGEMFIGHEYGAGLNQLAFFNSVLTNGVETELTIVRDATVKTWKLYVNRVQFGTTYNYTYQATGGTSAKLQFGKNNNNYYNGKLKNIRLYNTALSATDVANIENITSGLVGSWNLDETSGTIVHNTSGNNSGNGIKEVDIVGGSIVSLSSYSGHVQGAVRINETDIAISEATRVRIVDFTTGTTIATSPDLPYHSGDLTVHKGKIYVGHTPGAEFQSTPTNSIIYELDINTLEILRAVPSTLTYAAGAIGSDGQKLYVGYGGGSSVKGFIQEIDDVTLQAKGNLIVLDDMNGAIIYDKGIQTLEFINNKWYIAAYKAGFLGSQIVVTDPNFNILEADVVNSTTTWQEGLGLGLFFDTGGNFYYMKTLSSPYVPQIVSADYSSSYSYINGTAINIDETTFWGENISGVTADFSEFNGGSAVAMSDGNNDGVWVAEYTLAAGFTSGAKTASATATNVAGNNTSTADDGTIELDNTPVPVELISFTAKKINNLVVLNWQTATEVNNYGFSVQRKSQNSEWKDIAFVDGHGNSNSPKEYSLVDIDKLSGIVQYRLKQIDTDGSFEYSDVVEVYIDTPKEFKLSQNYPNPFNPTTMISYTLPTDSKVKIEITNILGQSVGVLVNGNKSAGDYETTWNAENLPSGTYFIKITAEGVNSKNSFTQVKKALLLK